jgi:DNA-binding beta-propeller fold protein YncE
MLAHDLPRIAPSLLLATLMAGCAAAATPAPGTAPLRLTAQWHIGGEGGWDLLAVDADRHRLFVTHSDRVEVIDTRSGTTVGTIAGTSGVHGVALAPDLGRGYTSNGKANSVTEFDLETLKVIAEAPVTGVFPDAIVYVPAGHHVIVFNGHSNNASVLDARSLKLIATLPLPGKPELAVYDAAGHVFVNIESEPGQIARIDLETLTVSATWPLPGCDDPTGLAVDSAGHRLFSACDAKVMAVTDSIDGHAVARITIGEHPDGAAFDAVRHLVLSSNGEGTLTIAHEDTADSFPVVQTLVTQRGARTMALDASSGRIYLVTADYGPAPAATAEEPHPRSPVLPGTFRVLVVEQGR